jgi:HK97 family phage prohead protease
MSHPKKHAPATGDKKTERPDLELRRLELSAAELRVVSDDGKPKRLLKVDIELPDTTVGRDVAVLVERGDLDGMSFGFRTVTDEWHTEDVGCDLSGLS